MRESIHKFFQVGTIQWMSYPDRDVAEGVRAIARDDFFDAIEISQIADDGKREEVKRLLEQSHLRVCYGAQPRLLGTGGRRPPSWRPSTRRSIWELEASPSWQENGRRRQRSWPTRSC